jgi:aminopeptidase N
MTVLREDDSGLDDFHTFVLPGATEHYAPDRPVRTEHVRIEVKLDFDAKEVAGNCTTTLHAVREVRSLTFDAVDMDVEGIAVNGERAAYSNSGRQIHIQLPSPLAQDRRAEATIRYRCKPSRGLYFWAPDEGYPDRPVQAWTQGQDEDSRAWFPSLDAPSQRATTEVLATFPAKMTALSNGALVSNQVMDGLRTTHYRFDFPHPAYLVTLVVGEFDEERASVGDTQLRYLFPKGRTADALRCVGRTPEMIALLEEIAGEKYPYGSYSQVFVTDFIFGGMENTSSTTLTDSVLHDARAHQDYSAEPLVAHELTHQWFGDLLTCREWPHAWLNEGFATYGEVLWKERSEGVDEADLYRATLLEAYLQEVRERYARPIVARKFHLPVDLFDRHLYQKAALVLHELRRRLGDEYFFRALRHYVKTNRVKSVETVDLARAIEEATGHNVDRLFDEYVFSAGHPELKAEVSYEAEERRVRIKVRQRQRTSTADGFPLFHLPLKVRVVVDRQAREQTFELADSEHLYFISSDDEPEQVSLDPNREILGTLEVDKPVDYWLRELKAAPEARARSEAALALGKIGSARAVEALESALLSDAFWGTQAASARALGQARTPHAKMALLRAIGLPHPKARRAVVAALGEFKRDREVAAALQRICEQGDRSYFVEGEAGRSLGKLRVDGSLPVLENMLSRRSFQEVVAAGAVEGMSENLSPKAYEIIEPLTRYGQPVFLRRAAVVALAKLAEPAQKKTEAIDVISELFRDPLFRIQYAAIEAARVLGDRRIIPSLESTPFLDGRAQRAALEAIRALREEEPKARQITGLQEELDRLKEETKSLKERLEQIEAPSGRRRSSRRPKGKSGGPSSAPRGGGRK